MLTQDYLSLRLVHLKPSEEWLSVPEQLTFVFPQGGRGKCVAGSFSQALGPGDVLLVNALPGGRIRVEGGGELVFWSCSVCLETLFPLFAASEICLLQNVLDDLKEAKLYPASGQMALECHRLLSEVPPQCDLSHRGQLLRIVAGVLSVEFKSVQRQHNGHVGVEQHLIQVFESLSSSEILNLPVGELAERFNCSRRHLNRLFHDYFGFSVAALKMEMRLLKAVSLLRSPEAKIIHVAEACGFNHLGLFNTCFKKRFGISPGKWRRTDGQAEEPPAEDTRRGPECPLHAEGACPMASGPGKVRPFDGGGPQSKKAAARRAPAAAPKSSPSQFAGSRGGAGSGKTPPDAASRVALRITLGK